MGCMGDSLRITRFWVGAAGGREVENDWKKTMGHSPTVASSSLICVGDTYANMHYVDS